MKSGIHHDAKKVSGELWWLCSEVTTTHNQHVYSYLVKSPKLLVQLLGCNVLTKGYRFYVTGWIPDDKDPVLVDAKLTLAYECHLPRYTVSKRRKAGHAAVKYYRCGQFFILIATHGRSEFFQREAFKDAAVSPINIAGYSLKVLQDGKVSVRIHREAQRKLRREFTERAAWDLKWWESRLKGFEFSAFSGVRNNLFHEVKHLNACRKMLRLPPVDWDRCVRKKIVREPVFLPSPPELMELLSWHKKNKKADATPLTS